MARSLTLFFIVEPPAYQYMACYLAASIRKHMPADVQLVGYCPQHRLSEIDPDAIETLRRMGCEVRGFGAEAKFDPAYPHGNKILAAQEPRDTAYSGFMDSDILLIRDNTPDVLIREGHVSASVAASMQWGAQSVWDEIYAACDMPLPQERIRLMRDKRQAVLPYFSSGFVVFPEGPGANGARFADVWMETAQRIDTLSLPARRPYLDQMSLPLAIRRAGLEWHELPEEQHYILGGTLRGKPLPEDMAIHTVHYRKWEVLAEAGLAGHGYHALREMAGARRVSWVPRSPMPARAQPAQDQPAAPATKTRGPDPSKARMAAVTMVHEDYFFLDRWVRYWSNQIGREHLYVLSHGHDARIRKIAEGANIVHVPNPEDRRGFDRRRWAALSNYTSSLTLYYNWVICNDVDEIVAVDPAVSNSVPDYLDEKFTTGAPMVLAPFALEIVHTPATEAGLIRADAPVLSVRRNFRINSNYAKPCITRGRIAFSIGGHGCTRKSVTLDEHLYLFHLRYVDAGLSRARLEKRRLWMEAKNGAVADGKRRTNTWEAGTQTFDRLSAQTPAAETVDFPEARQRMIEGRSSAATGNWFFGKARSAELYRLPERFAGVF